MTETKVDEEAVFDRQMRLWGADAQQKIRASRVLVRGRFLGLASELTKNLVLAGVNVTLMDDEPVAENDVLTNIFLRAEDVGKSRASAAIQRLQDMNPFADVQAATGKIGNLKSFTLIVSVSESFASIEELSDECRSSKVPLIAMHSAGLLSYALIDLGEQYSYAIEGKPNEPAILKYTSLKDVLSFTDFSSLPSGRQAVPDAMLAIWACRMFAGYSNGKSMKKAKVSSIDEVTAECAETIMAGKVKNFDEFQRAARIFTEGHSFTPVCTISGGVFGQEVLKVVSNQGEPVKNIIIVDGKDASAYVRQVPRAQ